MGVTGTVFNRFLGDLDNRIASDYKHIAATIFYLHFLGTIGCTVCAGLILAIPVSMIGKLIAMRAYAGIFP